MAAAVVGLMLGLGVQAAAAAPSTAQLMTNASPSTQVGLQVFDHTNLAGGAAPTGTLSFALYGPGDSACATPIFTSTVAVSGSGSDDSERFTTPGAGTYQWIAAYSGDQNNNPVSTVCGDPRQSVTVSKQYVGATVAASQAAGVVHGTLAINGGFSPGGQATFIITGPDDTWCSGAPVYTATVPVTGPGTYDSGAFRPTLPGRYTVRVRYDGDANNYGVGPTACLDQNASVAVGQALFTNPTNGQVLDKTRPFSWTPVSGAEQYALTVATYPGGRDLANIALPATAASFDVSLLPTGRTLYARLRTKLNGAWAGYQDVSFTTDGQGAVFTSPTGGQGAGTTRLSWSTVSGADQYGVWVGTTRASADLASTHLSNATSSYDISALPAGQTVYARIWTKVDGAWTRYQDISFTTGGGAASSRR